MAAIAATDSSVASPPATLEPAAAPVVWLRPVEHAEASAGPPPAPPEHLSIPAIGLDADVAPLGWEERQTDAGVVSVWQDLPADEAAWLLNSAAPGEGSNVVISGHHNMAGAVFRDLVLLQAGDQVIIRAGDRDFVYVVAERVIVPEKDALPEQRRQNASWMQPTRVERLTLITCWPQETNTHRLILVADPVEGTALALR
ncbi:MAG: sortase [Anaerolineae bacterium]